MFLLGTAETLFGQRSFALAAAIVVTMPVRTSAPTEQGPLLAGIKTDVVEGLR